MSSTSSDIGDSDVITPQTPPVRAYTWERLERQALERLKWDGRLRPYLSFQLSTGSRSIESMMNWVKELVADSSFKPSCSSSAVKTVGAGSATNPASPGRRIHS